MSLLVPNRKGNPQWAKGKSGNPEGRPRLGSTMGVKRTLAKLHRNPVEELVKLADVCSANRDYTTAIKIWDKLYDDSYDAGIDPEKEQKSTQKLLEELEKDEPRPSTPATSGSNPSQLGTGETKAPS